MKTFLLYCLLLLIPFSGYAQIKEIGNDLTIYSENGEKFTVFIFGKQVNDSAQSNVEVKNLNHSTIDVLIAFQDTALGTIRDKYLWLDLNTKGSPASSVFIIKKKKKKDGKEYRMLGLHSSTPKKLRYAHPSPAIIVDPAGTVKD